VRGLNKDGHAGFQIASGGGVTIYGRWGPIGGSDEMFLVRTGDGREGWISRLQLVNVAMSAGQAPVATEASLRE